MIKLPWSRKTEPAALPAPQAGTLKDDFAVAVYGRKFRTRTYISTVRPDEKECLKAVAIQPDLWRVIKTTSSPLSTHIRELENLSFQKAAEKLLAYELSAEHMNLLPVEEESDPECAHVRDFCLREGLVPDRNGKLHPLVNGEIVTQGEFDSADLETSRAMAGQRASGAFAGVWNRTLISDIFRRNEGRGTWKELNLDLIHLVSLKEAAHLAKTAEYIIRESLKTNGNMKITHYRFSSETELEGLSWARENFNYNNLCQSVLAHCRDRAGKLSLPDSLKEELVEYFTDLCIFELIRETRAHVQGSLKDSVVRKQNLETFIPSSRRKIDGWVDTVRELMEKNGYSAELIGRADQAMLCPEKFDSMPVEITQQCDRIKELYETMHKQLHYKLRAADNGLQPE